MIRAEFVIRDSKFCAFSIQGHAGFAPAPHDLVCAAVSSMSLLVLNTLQEVFSAELVIEEDETKPFLKMKVLSCRPEIEFSVQGVLRGFYLQLCDLEKQYPKNLSVQEKSSVREERNLS